jgi:CheY-like chemotaxis protein
VNHILIIEDDLLVALDVQVCAEELGAVSTALAASEDNAVRLAAERRPDLILSDVRLAQGSGPEAVRRIVEHHGPIPVIYITGNPETVQREDPDARIIVKPHSPKQLQEEARALGLIDAPG